MFSVLDTDNITEAIDRASMPDAFHPRLRERIDTVRRDFAKLRGRGAVGESTGAGTTRGEGRADVDGPPQESVRTR